MTDWWIPPYLHVETILKNLYCRYVTCQKITSTLDFIFCTYPTTVVVTWWAIRYETFVSWRTCSMFHDTVGSVISAHSSSREWTTGQRRRWSPISITTTSSKLPRLTSLRGSYEEVTDWSPTFDRPREEVTGKSDASDHLDMLRWSVVSADKLATSRVVIRFALLEWFYECQL